MESEYTVLVESAKTIHKAMQELNKEEGAYSSPAWKMLFNAANHVTKLAENELREESKWQRQS